jgi:hypothetical protein
MSWLSETIKTKSRQGVEASFPATQRADYQFLHEDDLE